MQTFLSLSRVSPGAQRKISCTLGGHHASTRFRRFSCNGTCIMSPLPAHKLADQSDKKNLFLAFLLLEGMPPSFLTISWFAFHDEGNPSSNLLYASASVSWSILLRDNALNLLDVTHDQTFVNPQRASTWVSVARKWGSASR